MIHSVGRAPLWATVIRQDAIRPEYRYSFVVLTWQVPVLAKYRWEREGWTPFTEAGPSLRFSGNKNGYRPSYFGLTAGAGLERRVGVTRLAPRVRYTWWAPGGRRGRPVTERNALEAIVALSF